MGCWRLRATAILSGKSLSLKLDHTPHLMKNFCVNSNIQGFSAETKLVNYQMVLLMLGNGINISNDRKKTKLRKPS